MKHIKSNRELKGKLVRSLMQKGKKKAATLIVNKAIIYVEANTSFRFNQVLYGAVIKSGSLLKLRNRRIGARNIKVPFPNTQNQFESVALRRLVQEARKDIGFDISERLGKTLIRAFGTKGQAVGLQKAEHLEIRKSRGNSKLRW